MVQRIKQQKDRPLSNIARFMRKHQIADFDALIGRANDDISWYWNAVNEDLQLKWFKMYERVFDSSKGLPWTEWFVGGQCNVIANALDRHLVNNGDHLAFIFDGSSGATRVSYRDLALRVNKLASAMRESGIKKGDVVAIYMPMIPEAFYALLACSKIGAVHVAIFSGFSSSALHSRLVDSGAKLLFTADTMTRHGKEISLKEHWAKAISSTNVKRVITVGQSHGNTVLNFHDFMRTGSESNRAKSTQTEVMNSEDPLFILYTSGTTGQPKGTLQVHGGFMVVAAQQSSYLIDMKANDVLFWYADIGWITGQTWVVYGSVITGGTSIVYDEALNFPNPDSWCSLVEDYNISILGMAPTAIRYSKASNVDTTAFDLSSLRILATTGESINKEAWDWYFERVGQKHCEIINLSGGTEAGGAILSPLPGTRPEPCSVGRPVPGFDAAIYDDNGNLTSKGYLVIRKPWPSMTRGLLNNPERFSEVYWSKFKNVWFHGDLVFKDKNGFWYITGRADDVIKVSGHRISTAEIEAVVMGNPRVSEAAAIGRNHALKGESIVLCIVPQKPSFGNKDLEKEVIQLVEQAIGKFASPEEIKFVSDLPRTRTGKLVRRLIKAKLSGDQLEPGQLAMIENPQSLDEI